MPTKTYETHDNGGRPFLVEVIGSHIIVYKNGEQLPLKQLYETSTKNIFIGKKSPLWGGYNGLSSKEAIGNSMLLHLGEKYVFIGHEIYEFSSIEGDTIHTFYSDIGNSDVPYPYAIGENYIYIILDKVAIEKSYFDMKKPIYDQYYEPNRAKISIRQAYDISEKERDRVKELDQKKKKLKTKQIIKRI